MNWTQDLEEAVRKLEGHHKNIRTLKALENLLNNLDRINIEDIENLCIASEIPKISKEEWMKALKEMQNQPLTFHPCHTKADIKKAFEAGEKNIDFKALHGQGKLLDAEKYYKINYDKGI